MKADPYRHVASLRAAQTRRKALSGITYNEGVHRSNPYALGDDAKIAAFIATHDQLTCEIFQQEAQPVRCFWSPTYLPTGPNRSSLSKAVEQDRAVGLLLIRATGVEQRLIEAEMRQNSEQIAKCTEEARRRQEGAGGPLAR